MPVIALDANGAPIGDVVDPAELGGEYLGWTGLPGWEVQAEHLGIHHIRWPAGIVAEDRIEPDGYAFDLSEPDLLDNWPRNNGTPRPGPTEMFAYANEIGASFAMIVPSARYVELMRDDPEAAKAWIRDDIEAFTTRLLNGDWGAVPPDFTLEIGAEYYSTDAWAALANDPNAEDYFAKVFAELVDALADVETAAGQDIYQIAVQASRFQSNDDTASTQDGEAGDSAAFIAAYQSAEVEDAIDALVWHRYVYTFDQVSHHLSPTPVAEHTLLDEVALWEAALGHPLETLIGWAAPDIDSTGASETDPFFDYGPRSAHSLLQMFAQLSASGMDRASVYGMDSEWIGALTAGSNAPDVYHVSFMGEVFAMMTESLPGLTSTDVFLSNSVVIDGQNGIVEADHVNLFTYSDGQSQQVTYAALWDLVSPEISITLAPPTDFDATLVQVRVVRPDSLDRDAGGAHVTPNVLPTGDHAQIAALTDFDVVEASFLLGGASFDAPQRTTLSLETGNTHTALSHDADTFDFRNSPDQMVSGLGGNDVINGAAQGDIIAGGVGDDLLSGGDGGDVLLGDDAMDQWILDWLETGAFSTDPI